MQISSEPDAPTLAQSDRAHTGSIPSLMHGWRRTARNASIGMMITALLMMAAGRFLGPSLVLSSALLAIGVWRLSKPGRSGLIVLAVVATLSLLFHIPITALILAELRSPVSFTLGAAHLLCSIVCAVASVAALSGRSGESSPKRTLAIGSAVVAVCAISSGVAFATRTNDDRRPGDAQWITNGTSIETAQLSATAGAVSLLLVNDDPLWLRSFDIDQLDVHEVLPPNTSRRVIVTVAAGTYALHDEITLTSATEGQLVVASAESTTALYCALVSEINELQGGFPTDVQIDELIALAPTEIQADVAIVEPAFRELAVTGEPAAAFSDPAVEAALSRINEFERTACQPSG